MKKLFSVVLIMASGLTFFSCSSDEEIYVPQEVDLTLDFTFAESGSMTRATGEEVYDAFYEKYIKTKKLTPQNYNLEFYQGQKLCLTIEGQWGDKTGIRLPEGEYTVTGYSYPIETYASRPTYLPSDTVYITFSESIKITKDMSVLTLKANYASSLVLFDKANKTKVELNVGSKQLSSDDTCYWLFARDKTWTTYDNGFSFSHSLSTKIIRETGDSIQISLGNLPLAYGKYYYFNDMTNSFDIPKMESGN